jgi:hypothetical protein
MAYPQVQPIVSEGSSGRVEQLQNGQGNNAYCRASDYNKMQYFLMNLNTLLLDCADDSAASTAGVPIGGWYRSTSTVKIRVA